jgi:predicted nucleotidyltransferase
MIKFGKPLNDIKIKLPLMVSELSKRSDIVAIYLFGSQAKDTADALSDVDVALLLKTDHVPLEHELDLIDTISSILKTDEISLVILNNAPLTIRYGVIHDAKVLYCAEEGTRRCFEEGVMKKYLDFKYYLDRYDHEFVSLMKYGKV